MLQAGVVITAPFPINLNRGLHGLVILPYYSCQGGVTKMASKVARVNYKNFVRTLYLLLIRAALFQIN